MRQLLITYLIIHEERKLLITILVLKGRKRRFSVNKDNLSVLTYKGEYIQMRLTCKGNTKITIERINFRVKKIFTIFWQNQCSVDLNNKYFVWSLKTFTHTSHISYWYNYSLWGLIRVRSIGQLYVIIINPGNYEGCILVKRNKKYVFNNLLQCKVHFSDWDWMIKVFYTCEWFGHSTHQVS